MNYDYDPTNTSKPGDHFPEIERPRQPVTLDIYARNYNVTHYFDEDGNPRWENLKSFQK